MKLKAVCYHYIYSEKNKYLRRGVKVCNLKKQFEFLKQNYQIIHFSDLSNTPPDDNYCIITFDDGIKEFYTEVFPLLDELDIKATLFVCSSVYTEKKVLNMQKMHLLSTTLGTDNFKEKFYSQIPGFPGGFGRENVLSIDCSTIYPYDTNSVRQFKLDLNYRLPIHLVNQVVDEVFSTVFNVPEQQVVHEIYITEAQLRLLNESTLVEIGAHGAHHFILSRLSVKEQENQIYDSIDYLHNSIGCAVPIPFSYPFGRNGTYTEQTKSILINDDRVGWACNMQRLDNENGFDKYDINRFDVNDIFPKESS